MWTLTCILTIPWILDIWTRAGALESAFGALMWGAAVLLAAFLPATRDQRLRQSLRAALALLSACWLLYWGLMTVTLSVPMPALRPEALQFLRLSHAGLLAAGAGMVLSVWAGAAMWLWRERELRRSSWERRTHSSNLPSLESLERFCRRGVALAFVAWFMGLILAFLAAHMKWHEWLGDPKVFVSVLLAVLLLLCLQFQLRRPASLRALFRAYVALSTLFLIFFAWMLGGGVASLHEPIRFFLR